MKQTWLGLCVLMAACSPTLQGSGDTDIPNEGTAPQTIEDPCAFGACDSDPEPVIDDEEWRVLGLISASYANGMFTFSSVNDDGCTDCIESAGVKPVRVATSTVGFPYRPDGKGGLQSTPLSEISWTHSKSLSNRYAYAFLEVVDDPENAFPQQFHTFGTEESVLDVPYRSHPDAPNLRNPLLPLSSGENPLYFWRDIDQFSVTFALKARVADCSDSKAGMQCSPPGAACDTDADCARGTCVDTEEGGVCGSVMPEDTCNPCTDYCPGTLNVARQFGFNAVSPEDVSFDGRYWQYAFEDDAVATADDVEAALRPKLEAHIGETWNSKYRSYMSVNCSEPTGQSPSRWRHIYPWSRPLNRKSHRATQPGNALASTRDNRRLSPV